MDLHANASQLEAQSPALVPESENLPNGFTRQALAQSITPRHQGMTILPTEKCNFRCVYCYEDFEIGKMSEVTQLALERFLSRRIPAIESLYLGWFGGEPLLAKDVVLRIARHAQKVCAEHGTRLDGGFTTNAYLLTRDLAEELISLDHCFYQITLDGFGDGHDRTRRRADGRGTFQTIWENLLAMRSIPGRFTVSVRAHVHQDNLESLEELMRQLAANFGADTRFGVDFQHLRDMGGAGGQAIERKVTLEELPQVEARMRAILRAELSRLGYLRPESYRMAETKRRETPAMGESAGSRPRTSRDVVEGSPYICYATAPNNILLRADGRLGRCTVALDDDRNVIGHLAEDGSLVIDDQKLRPWFRGFDYLDLEQMACPLKGMPHAGPAPARNPAGKVIPIRQIN